MAKKVKIAIAIDPDVLTRVDALASAENRSRSSMVERLVMDAVVNAEMFTNAMSNRTVRDAMLGAMSNPNVFREILTSAKESVSARDLEELQKAALQGFEAAGQNMEAVKRTETGSKGKPRRAPAAGKLKSSPKSEGKES